MNFTACRPSRAATLSTVTARIRAIRLLSFFCVHQFIVWLARSQAFLFARVLPVALREDRPRPLKTGLPVIAKAFPFALVDWENIYARVASG
jgi:hypothetical protein